ncbi:RNA polymerase sigma-H factor [bioreactor metagenome]|uniref:RNA polymerase sigma-H factor n=1 Tax=bioreactor metagenome TaxID=1076179 RepID=A0A645BJJ8_9ZZZZ
MPLNSYISINKPFCEDESDRALSDMGTFGLEVSDPEEVFIGKEDIEFLEQTIEKMLSGLEKKVFNLYVSGKTYVEIANLLNKPVKSVDNAIQRIRRKLGSLLKKE